MRRGFDSRVRITR